MKPHEIEQLGDDLLAVVANLLKRFQNLTVWTVVYQDHDGSGMLAVRNYETKESALAWIREIMSRSEYYGVVVDDGYDLNNDDDVASLVERWRGYTDDNEELELCSGTINK